MIEKFQKIFHFLIFVSQKPAFIHREIWVYITINQPILAQKSPLYKNSGIMP